jgi:hypothetical protein
MPRYRVAEIRLHLGDRWLELPVEPSTTLAIDPPDPPIATPGKPTGSGMWDVGPVAGFPGTVTSGGRYDVAITTTDGTRWCGPAFAIWYSRQLLGDGPLEEC